VRGKLPLADEGELRLGAHCLLAFRLVAPAVVELRGATGLDRTLRALVGLAGAPLPLPLAIAGAEGLALRFDGPVCRLERAPNTAVRVDGRLVGTTCDLLRGDVVDVPARGLRFEVT
jgi:hypothetical protein